ncbi:hypothetical protein LCGC14_1684930, partial [marine sediment metagenome]
MIKKLLFSLLLLALPFTCFSADRYWVGGADTNNWLETSPTTNWSASSGGALDASIPGSFDDVYFDVNSLDCTMDSGGSGQNFDFTSYTNTLNHTGGNFQAYGNVTLVSGAYTYNSASRWFRMRATGNLITDGVNLPVLVVDGGATTVTFADTITVATINLISGTLDTNGQAVTCVSLSSSNSNTRTLDLGASTVTVTGGGGSATTVWNFVTSTNLTFTEGTSTIIFTGANARIYPGSETFYEVQFTGSGAPLINGGCNFTTLTRTGTAVKTDSLKIWGTSTVSGTLTLNGNSATNRLLVLSNSFGDDQTISAGTVVSNNADYREIIGAGTGDWDLSGGLVGDCGGNTGITFTTADIMYWHVDAGLWSDANKWFLATDGGGGAGRTPLPQDDVVFDANSFDNGSQTITMDMPRVGKSVNFTGITDSPTFNDTIPWTIYGSLTLVSGMTWLHNQNTYFEGRGAFTLTSAGKSF